MKIAIFSDVHGNLPALKQVLKEIMAARPQRILCLGDLAFKGPAPRDCLELLRQYPVEIIHGNTDRMLLGRELPGSTTLPLRFQLDWHCAQLTLTDLAWLAGLPEKLEIATPSGNLLAVHGAPKDCVTPILPDSEPGYLEEVMGGAAPRWLAAGHTHLPMILQHGSTTIINPGPVGFSLDGDWRAGWALLDAEAQEVHHFRVAYDVEEAVALAEKRDFCIPPQEYREWLLKAKQ